jgi:filamentous hemagglutinin family protein
MFSYGLYPRLITIGIFTTLGLAAPATAQITPDATLGAESSRLTPNVLIQGGNADRVDGGAQRSGNLFHSFSQFNVADGQTLYFNNPTGVRNILTRVTGSSVSNILGQLGVDGNANLFLLNPNGIVFGPKSVVFTPGTFMATTASRIQFPEGAFSAVNPQQPPLLTISAPIGLGFDQVPKPIVVQSKFLLSNQGIALVGGNITAGNPNQNVLIGASGGRVELAAIGGQGEVGVAINEKSIPLTIPNSLARADIAISDSAIITSGKESGGTLMITARNFDLANGQLLAGVLTNGSGGKKSDDIILDASERITLRGGSIVSNAMLGKAGDGGDIRIQTGSLDVLDGTQIATYHNGIGQGGKIVINAREDVVLAGEQLAGQQVSPTSATTYSNKGVGNAGDIQITAKNLSLLSGAILDTVSNRVGNSGNIVLNIQNETILDGTSSPDTSSPENPSGISLPSGFVTALAGNGKGGDITLNTGSLNITNLASIRSNLFGKGKGGDIKINARGHILLDGGTANGAVTSGINSETFGVSIGDGGRIEITAESLRLSNRAAISTSSSNTGNAGSIRIDLFSPDNSLILRSGGKIDALTNGKGNAGQVVINAKGEIVVDGGQPFEFAGGQLFVPSAINSSVLSAAGGNGGDIQIEARSLTMSNGGNINSGTSGRGNGGNIRINTQDSVNILGEAPGTYSFQGMPIAIYVSSISSQISDNFILSDDRQLSNISQSDIERRGGSIQIVTRNLNLTDGSTITTLSSSRGTAGNIDINTSGEIAVSGSGRAGEPSRIISIARFVDKFGVKQQAIGKAGDINLSSRDLLLNGGLITASSTSPTGIAANVSISANRIRLNNSTIKTESILGDGGNLTFNVGDYLLLRNNSQISTSAGTEAAGGNGGQIRISAPIIVAVPKEDSDIKANAFSGSGGTVYIQTSALIGIKPAPKLTPLSDITASSDQGVQGTIAITQPDVQPEQGLTELPGDILDASNQIGQSCPNARNGRTAGSFVVSGRGSLPTSPLDPLADNPNLPALAQLSQADRSIAQTLTIPPPQATVSIVEAQGWQKTADGKVMLIAQPVQLMPTFASVATCPVTQ